MSFGLYGFFWPYRAWKFLRVEMQEDVRPSVRTFLMLVPVVGQVLWFRLVKDISWFVSRSDGSAFLIVMWIWGCFVLIRLTDGVSDVAAVPFLLAAGAGVWVVQRRINTYYAEHAGIVTSRMPLYGWVTCGIGLLLWIVTILDMAGVIAAD